MNQVKILLVHVGSTAPPKYVYDNLAILRKIAPKSKIQFMANAIYENDFLNHIKLNHHTNESLSSFIAIENIQQSQISKEFEARSTLDRNFRQGFWYNTTYRFFLIADWLNQTGQENTLHLENDVLLYFDPTDKVSIFRDFSSFSTPLDRVRSIPGSVWFRNAEVATLLAQFIDKKPGQNDMETLGQFCMEFPKIAKPLPTIPMQYALNKKLDLHRFCEGLEAFGGVFDAAAIGQYLGGIHRLNDNNSTIFFVNESSALNLNEFNFSWKSNQSHRMGVLKTINETTPILSIHAHSKDLLGISPFNFPRIPSSDMLISGEKIQKIADITIGTQAITNFHGRANIETPELVELPTNTNELLSEHGQQLIKKIQSNKVLFVYTHLIPYFKHYIAPWIKEEFVLISHNSDDAVTNKDLGLLNNPLLKYWYAQNCEFHHTKLKPLPIGLANKQWGAKNAQSLFSISQSIEKNKLIYLNFSPNTYSSRRETFDKIKEFPGVTTESGLSYSEYIKSMAEHKFVICPRGNGLDTHRFWEAQYLQTIPIILEQDWTPSYSLLPVLVIKSWDSLKDADMNKIYIFITTKQLDYQCLNLSFYEQLIRGNI